MPQALYFTDLDEANELIAREPLALLIGFALDQQITMQTAFLGPLKLKQRVGSLDAAAISSMDPQELVDALLASFQPRITLEDLNPDPPEAPEV